MSSYTYRLCPHCDCSRLERTHRGFIKKYMLRMTPMFICDQCKKNVSQSEIKHEPMFNTVSRKNTKSPS